MKEILEILNNPMKLMQDGGPLMWPLLVIFIIALFLVVERLIFWIRTNNRHRIDRIYLLCQHLRRGETDHVMQLVDNDQSVYGILTRELIVEGASPAVVNATVERLRPRIERFMTILNSIITAAPMLGILGTVIGIMAEFRQIGETENLSLTTVGGGIGQALITTVAGLVISLLVVFPFNAFKTHIDRTLGRLESLIAAARGESEEEAFGEDKPQAGPTSQNTAASNTEDHTDPTPPPPSTDADQPPTPPASSD